MEINENKDNKGMNNSKNISKEKKTTPENNKTSNNKDINKKISKSKKRRMIKKEKYISIKKMEYLNRQNILNSLEQHNKANAQLASELISIKNIGQKRKREKNKNKEQKNINIDKDKEINDINNDNENLSNISSSSDEEINNEEEPKIKPVSKPLINGMTPQEFLNKLLEEKRHQRQLEEMSEIKQYLYGDNSLYIPSQKSSVVINRTPEIIEQRSKLPIISQEHDIMYSINNSLVTIICGETGSGKSTQIPQFLYERGYTKEIGKIAITQPRRVAARSLAVRLREEMSMKQGLEIGYQVRYETDNINKNTEIKFITDGILLKELENDFLLSQYSVIIIDEAHERTINSDLLIGFISQILKIRYIMWKRNMKYNYNNELNNNEKNVLPLRLIIMSATLRVSEFSENKIFSGILKPRVVEISSRQYPVHIYHSKKTENDYINEAFKYCCKIHSRLPEGNVIVFLTGKREILDLCKKLKDEFNGIKDMDNSELNDNNNDNTEKKDEIILKEEKDNSNKIEEKKEEEKIVDEIDSNKTNIIQEDKKNYSPVIILPLYSSMEPEEQMKIYQDHKGKRMIVISTNVAETSLTIPGVRYVIDSGRVKKRIYKSGLSFSTFKIEWISQASSNQRSGRAGRTCEGYCYRLYSNGLYVKMDKFTEPQISTSPLSQVILTLKSMKVKNIYNFPFITKPKLFFIDKSLEHLVNLGAIDIPDIENINKLNRIMSMLKDNKNKDIDNINKKNIQDKENDLIKDMIIDNNNDEENNNDINNDNISENDEESEDIEKRQDSTTITEIGKLMAKFPVEPKLGKILIMANNFDLIEYAILIVAILSIENLIDFTSLNLSKKEYKEILKELNAYNNLSDILTYLSIVILTLKGKNKKININSKKITELKNLSNQLTSLCKYNFKKNIKKLSEISLPTNNQEVLLLQILLSSFIDNIARKRVLFDSVGNEIKINSNKLSKKEEQIIKKKIVYECNENNKECKIYNYSTISDAFPEYLIYTEIISENNNNFLHLNSCFKTDWLYNLGGNLVKTSLSLNLKEPYYNKKSDSICCLVDIIYGYKRWEINNIAVEMSSDEPKFYYYFARFLLEGEIIEELKKYKKMLNSNPNIITNKISDMYIKVSKLIVALKGNKICNKEDLINKLKKDKNFLKDVIIMWYDNPNIKKIIREKWPFLK